MQTKTVRYTEKTIREHREPQRRARIRLPSGPEAPPSSPRAKAPLFARVREMSEGGITLVFHTIIPGGTEITIELPTKTPGATLTLLAHVLHSLWREDGNWDVCCQLVTQVTSEQLDSLL